MLLVLKMRERNILTAATQGIRKSKTKHILTGSNRGAEVPCTWCPAQGVFALNAGSGGVNSSQGTVRLPRRPQEKVTKNHPLSQHRSLSCQHTKPSIPFQSF
jgi:hypothetical protein